MQQLLVSTVSLMQPRTGCLHGRRCTPNLTLWQTEMTSPKLAPRLPTQSAPRPRWLITKHDGAGRVELPLARICSAQRVHGIETSAVIAPLPARASPRICSANRAARSKLQWLRAGSENLQDRHVHQRWNRRCHATCRHTSAEVLGSAGLHSRPLHGGNPQAQNPVQRMALHGM